MEINDLIPNQFYYSSHSEGWIVKFSHVKDGTRIMSHMCMPIEYGAMWNNIDSPKGWGQWDDLNKDLRLATYEEINWILSAMVAKKWIPMPVMSYSIF